MLYFLYSTRSSALSYTHIIYTLHKHKLTTKLIHMLTDTDTANLPNHFPLKTVPNDPDPILSPISSSDLLISQVFPESLVFCITRKGGINM